MFKKRFLTRQEIGSIFFFFISSQVKTENYLLKVAMLLLQVKSVHFTHNEKQHLGCYYHALLCT